MLALAMVAAVASLAQATTITFTTDTTWLATNVNPGPASPPGTTPSAASWNTDLSFNTASWQNAVNVYTVLPSCIPICIWYDSQNSATYEVWFRDTFFLDGPAISGTLAGFTDDDASVWINGNLVYSVFDSFATGWGPFNVTPYLVAGTNLIAVYAFDASGYSGGVKEHNFGINYLTVETAPVPEPMSFLLLGSGLSALAVRRYRRRPV